METIADVKRELPTLPIKVGDKVYQGHVKGRRLDYPHVYVFELDQSWEYCWETVTRAINNGLTLKV